MKISADTLKKIIIEELSFFNEDDAPVNKTADAVGSAVEKNSMLRSSAKKAASGNLETLQGALEKAIDPFRKKGNQRLIVQALKNIIMKEKDRK
jgi:hypothetical protein